MSKLRETAKQTAERFLSMCKGNKTQALFELFLREKDFGNDEYDFKNAMIELKKLNS